MGTPTPSTPVGSVETMEPHLWVRRGAPPSMPYSHRHDDLEVNLVLSGRLDYLFGGTPLTVTAGQVALFWGATPHRLIDSDQRGDVCWVHIPLSIVLGWGLADRAVGTILSTTPVLVPSDALARDAEAMFDCWATDLDHDETAEIVLLEAQAFVRRVLRHHLSNAAGVADRATTGGDALQGVSAMAHHAVTHFRDPISPSSIARSVHLSPSYAMALFKETVGTTLGSYLTRCRLTEAQRLLITTTMPTAEITHTAGFGSLSSFYDQFTRNCGCSPGAYRRALR